MYIPCVCGGTAHLIALGNRGHVVFSCVECGRTGFPGAGTRDGAASSWRDRMERAKSPTVAEEREI